MDKLIITVAPDAQPAQLATYRDLPHTPEEIAQEVVAAWDAGAAISHLHVLDEEGNPTHDLSAFQRTIDLIRARCDIVIEGSTGGLTRFSAPERSVALQADIELASLNPGSVNFGDQVYTNSPQDIEYWVKQMQRSRIKPTIAIFDVAMIENAMHYVRQGAIAGPAFFNLVLGQPGAIPATPRNLMFLIDSLPHGALWQAMGHGRHNLTVALWAIAFGGHARAGYEDSIFTREGERATSNAALIDRIVRIAREAERGIASPRDARAMLGLVPSD